MSTGARTAVGAVVLIVFGGGGFALWQRAQPAGEEAAQSEAAAPAAEATPTEQPKAAIAAEPVAPEAPASAVVANAPAEPVAAPAPATPAAADVATVEPAPTAAPTPDGSAPGLDLVRIEADGTSMVAGQAAAGTRLSVRANGIEVASATADAAGKFVALFNLPPSASGQMLTLVAVMPDGSELASASQVAIATISPPAVAVAQAPTDPAAVAPQPSAEPAPIAEPAPTGTTTALAVTDGAVKVLQGGPEVAGAVTLEVIAYPSAEAVQFGGKGAAGSFVQLYLDNAPLGGAEPIAADGSWSVMRAGIVPGIYTLRVDQLGADGKVTARFETPFKRETPEALAAVAAPETAVASALAGDVAVPAETALAAAPAAEPAAAPAAEPAPAANTVVADAAIAGSVVAAPAESAVTEPAAAETTPAAAPESAAAPKSAAAKPAAVDPVVTEGATLEGLPAEPAPTEPAPDLPSPAEATLAAPTPAEAAPVTNAGPISITVQPGYTLWGIAEASIGNGVLYVQVFEANRDKIKDPDLIYPGQVFTIPQE